MEKHFKKGLYCSQCNIYFDNQLELLTHRAQAHSKIPFIRKYVQLSPEGSGNTSSNSSDNNTGNKSGFRCTFDGCSKVFKFERNLNSHIVNLHSKQ